jgi:hypothetical protein
VAPQPTPALVNLTWWATGVLSRLTGWTLDGAFAAVGVAAALLMGLAARCCARVAPREPHAHGASCSS